MRITLGVLLMPEPTQRLNYRVLRLRLARVNHVVNFRDTAEVGMIFLTLFRRNPALMSVGILVKLAVSKVFPQQPKLPHVIGNIFTDVTNGAVGTNNYF